MADNKKNHLYLIKISDEKETFYKIGNSVHRFCRFYEIMKSGYEVEIIYMIFNLDFTVSYGYEKILQEHFSSKSYKPLKKFGGYTECFKYIDIQDYISIVSETITDNEITKNLKITWR
jgi:hypothetical protein